MKPAIVRCVVCGHRLTAEESVKREIGPVCWRRLKKIQKLDHWNQASERTDCTEYVVCKMEAHGNGHGLDCTDCQVYTHEEPTLGLPACPSCGKQSPNPRYCIRCGSPMKKALEVLA